MPWALLGAAIATEVAGALASSRLERFTRLVPSITVAAGYLASFGLPALVFKTLPVDIVYAIWAAVGVALVAILGKIMFNHPVPPVAMIGMVLIVAGVVLVSLSGATGH